MGATANDPISVLFAAVPEDALARLSAEVEQRRPALIIVDPLFRLIIVRGIAWAGRREVNPKAEIRGPKEVRRPNSE